MLQVANKEGGYFVITSRIYGTVRVTLLSAFLALAVCSFVTFGVGSAHAMTRQAASRSTSSTRFDRIVLNGQGVAVFSPASIFFKAGTSVTVTIKNDTGSSQELQVPFHGLKSYAPGQSVSFTLPADATGVEVFNVTDGQVLRVFPVS